MRFPHHRLVSPLDLRRRIERLDGLPVRPALARLVVNTAGDLPDDLNASFFETPKVQALAEIDPGCVLELMRVGGQIRAATVDP